MYEQDDYWKKCNACPHSGKCCDGAAIKILDEEWPLIKNYLDSLPSDEIQKLRYNVVNEILCPFHFPTKCLIHEVRPFVCRATPYKVQYAASGKTIHYNHDDNCNFSYEEKPFTPLTISHFANPISLINNRYLINFTNFCINHSIEPMLLKPVQLYLKDYFSFKGA